ncbi:MAG: DUF6455 family protein [Paracoccaceae bacterium]|jgi:hypothetical protein
MKTNALPLGDPAVHFWLTRSAARAMGVNLSEAMAAGRLSAQGYSEMVTACRGCGFVQVCQEWLATEAVPRCAAYEACAHKPVLEQLQ